MWKVVHLKVFVCLHCGYVEQYIRDVEKRRMDIVEHLDPPGTI